MNKFLYYYRFLYRYTTSYILRDVNMSWFDYVRSLDKETSKRLLDIEFEITNGNSYELDHLLKLTIERIQMEKYNEK